MTTRVNLLDTAQLSSQYRAQAIDSIQKRLLLTRFTNTLQEKDLTRPPNCNGFGRIRHFRRNTNTGWPSNPLPIDPACQTLGLPRTDLLEAQVFQNAVCNWRCWYCFVPFNMLSANPKTSDWISPSTLVDLYMAEPDKAPMIDLTGGQPDLVPEWVPWMMKELLARGLEKKTYLWSDDNLSSDFFWRFLTDEDRDLIASYPNYGRVCCFKGFNAESFSFNTRAEPVLFDRQFELMGRFLALGIDLYAYVTLTTPTSDNIEEDIACFMDRLQALDRNLPLRTVPLEIQVYTPVAPRVKSSHKEAIQNQYLAIAAWQKELEYRFTSHERHANIADVHLKGSR